MFDKLINSDISSDDIEKSKKEKAREVQSKVKEQAQKYAKNRCVIPQRFIDDWLMIYILLGCQY